MPRTYFGPYNENYSTYANAGNANLGRWPLGHILILPDNREYHFTLNDGTAEVAGNLYQSVASVANHVDVTADVARAIGATVISATLGATAAAVDIYAEGAVHSSNDTGESYAYRIRRAMTAGASHASAATSSILTVNLEAGEAVQVALDTTSEVTFTRNRYHAVIITAAPPTAALAGVSPGVAAANRFYWSQCKGYAAVLASGTLLAGLPVMAGITTAGSVESTKRRLVGAGTTALLNTATMTVVYLQDSDGTTTTYGIVTTSAGTTTARDVTGPIAANAPTVGMCVKANSTTQYALIALDIN